MRDVNPCLSCRNFRWRKKGGEGLVGKRTLFFACPVLTTRGLFFRFISWVLRPSLLLPRLITAVFPPHVAGLQVGHQQPARHPESGRRQRGKLPGEVDKVREIPWHPHAPHQDLQVPMLVLPTHYGNCFSLGLGTSAGCVCVMETRMRAQYLGRCQAPDIHPILS